MGSMVVGGADTVEWCCVGTVCVPLTWLHLLLLQTHSVQVIEDLEKDPLQWSLVYQDQDGEKYFFFLVSTALPQLSFTQHSITQHSLTQHSITQHSLTQHSTQHSITQHSLTQHSLTQHSSTSPSSLSFVLPAQSSSSENKKEWVQRVKKILRSLEALARGDTASRTNSTPPLNHTLP